MEMYIFALNTVYGSSLGSLQYDKLYLYVKYLIIGSRNKYRQHNIIKLISAQIKIDQTI